MLTVGLSGFKKLHLAVLCIVDRKPSQGIIDP
jgi:hypothetical protein